MLSNDDLLAELIEELKDVYDELGFLRSQELLKKKEVWERDPTASIQTRDRTATYAAAEITVEIYKAEARLHSLNVQRSYIERLLDAQR